MNEEPQFKVYPPLKNEDKQKSYLNKSLPTPPFRMVLLGHSGSGKTQLILNFLYSKGFYRRYFDNIFIFCGSQDDCAEYRRYASKTKVEQWNDEKDKYYKTIKEPMSEKVMVFQSTTEEELEELYDELENNPEYADQAHLFIFDDQITSSLLQSKKMGMVDKLFVQGRHVGKGISTILAVQKLRALKQNMRTTNSTHIIAFHGISSMELEVLAKENSGHLTEDDFKKLFRKYVSKKFKFIVINQKADAEKRFQDNDFKIIPM